MANDFRSRIKKINAKEEVEIIKEINAIKTQLVVTTRTNLFQHWMQKNSNSSDSDNDENKLEIL